MASRESVALNVFALCESFGRETTEATLRVFERVLRDVDDEQLQRGVDAVLRSSRSFMPTAGQLRQLCILGGDTVESRALAAWDVALDARRKAGPRDSVRFSDPLIAETIRKVAGGWPDFAYKIRDGGAEFLRKPFVEIYSAGLEHGDNSRDAPAVLLGTDEINQSEWSRKRYGQPRRIEIESTYEIPRALSGPTTPVTRLPMPSPQPEFVS